MPTASTAIPAVPGMLTSSMSLAALVEADLGRDRLVDPDWFALAWYGQSLNRLCAGHQLARLAGRQSTGAEWLDRCHGVASGHVVAASPELAGTAVAPGTVVIGGPCIGDCTRFPTLEALYDTVQTALVARALDADALFYVGDREEAMARTGEGRTWRALGERFAAWIPALAAAAGWTRVTVVTTGSDRHQAALESLGDLGAAFPAAELDAAFHLGAGPVKAQPDDARAVSARVVAAHLPEVVFGHLDREPTAPLVMSENLQQAGVFRLARARRGSAALGFVAHLPAPAMTARRRMYRSDSWDKVPAAELTTVVSGSVPGLHPYARQFFASWLGPELRQAVADAARRF